MKNLTKIQEQEAKKKEAVAYLKGCNIKTIILRETEGKGASDYFEIFFFNTTTNYLENITGAVCNVLERKLDKKNRLALGVLQLSRRKVIKQAIEDIAGEVVKIQVI